MMHVIVDTTQDNWRMALPYLWRKLPEFVKVHYVDALTGLEIGPS